jgi:hypothetical protein
LFSCGKDGIDGRNGRNGKDGRDGKDGVQITTRYFDVQPSLLEWKAAGDYGLEGYYCYADVRCTELTSSVIEKGAVLVYMIEKVGNEEFDNQLPYLIPYDGYTRIIRYDLRPGTIGFIAEDVDFKTKLPPFMGTVTFKVVIIQ